MHPPGATTVVVRHGDIGVKSPKIRRAMENKLRKNLAGMLDARDVPGDVETDWGRLYIETDSAQLEAATDTVTDTFGVLSASPALTVDPEKDAILEALARTADALYTGGTFGVDAHRADKSLPFTSHELNRDGGTAIWETVEDEFEPAVDLDDPDVRFSVEARSDRALVYVETQDGPGGLPLGTQGRVVALISGGIDSPVAAWELMKRGCEIIPVYLDLGEYGGIDHEARAIETVRKLAVYAPDRDMRVRKLPAGEFVADLVGNVGATRMLSYRRFMFKAAEHVAVAEGAHGIVTGEAIGQKSSQTGANLSVTSAVTNLPIHRPLLTWDKHEITQKAREIGTFQDSTMNAGCNRIAPDYPETNAILEQVEAAEPGGLLDAARTVAENVGLVDLGVPAPS